MKAQEVIDIFQNTNPPMVFFDGKYREITAIILKKVKTQNKRYENKGGMKVITCVEFLDENLNTTYSVRASRVSGNKPQKEEI